MEIFKEIGPLKAFLKAKRITGESIGLVPTMGALHRGHLALIQECKRENNVSVCSIYVNPLQFNNKEDLINYPRNLQKDFDLLSEAGCDVVFTPVNEEMYDVPSTMKFDFGALDKVMEGYHRPGHFSGVALVVGKLFNIVVPDKAYFGQKDWQQFAIIRQLVKELKFGLALGSVPTVREADGLAMSSRNLRLNTGQRAKATIFYNALRTAKEALLAGTQLNVVKAQVKAMSEEQAGVKLEYIELADSLNLNLLNNVEESSHPILCIAGYVDTIRLIDNMFLNSHRMTF